MDTMESAGARGRPRSAFPSFVGSSGRPELNELTAAAPHCQCKCVHTNSTILEVMGQRGLQIVPRTDKWLEWELAMAEGGTRPTPRSDDPSNPVPSQPAIGVIATRQRWVPACPHSSGP